VLLCSTRLATFPQADGVVVLDGGRIIERGTHTALLEAGGVYATIFQAQGRADQQRDRGGSSAPVPGRRQ
jgi:ABC-type multidrug transport system fused ATPase/permease subunit